MFYYFKGDLLKSNTGALVNTVNCEGVMGKGLAEQFKRKYPGNFSAYQVYCREGKLRPGGIFVFQESNKIILNFATKGKWKKQSKIEYVREGLYQLREFLSVNPVDSISLPPLGCGLGFLKWEEVLPLIVEILRPLEQKMDILIYGEPVSGFEFEKLASYSRKVDCLDINTSLAVILNMCWGLGKPLSYVSAGLVDKLLGTDCFGVRFSDGKYYFRHREHFMQTLAEKRSVWAGTGGTIESAAFAVLNCSLPDQDVFRVFEMVHETMNTLETSLEKNSLIYIIDELERVSVTNKEQLHSQLNSKFSGLSTDESRKITEKVLEALIRTGLVEETLFEYRYIPRKTLLMSEEVAVSALTREELALGEKRVICLQHLLDSSTASQPVPVSESLSDRSEKNRILGLDDKIHFNQENLSLKSEREEKVSINQADLKELCRLPGIGQAIARKIIEMREKLGEFRTIEDLKKVKGIGNKVYNYLLDQSLLSL